MPIPSYAVGQVLGAADVNNWFIPAGATAITDQSITTNIAGVSDNTLAVAVAANATWQVDLFIRCNGPAANSFVGQFTGPAGSSLSATYVNSAATADIGLSGIFGVPTTGTGNDLTFAVTGTFTTGATAGTLQFQFAQGSSSATATTRRVRSRLILRRIG